MKYLEWAAGTVSRRANLFALAVVVTFFAGALIESARRPFWNDEYFTLVIAQQPTLGAALTALENGVDLNPPLFHLATRLTTKILGLNRIGLRLPAVIGFSAMMIGIFCFVTRALPGPPGRMCGLAAMMLPFLTGMNYYASEGRSYGLMLGFLSLALVFWQSSQGSWKSSLLCGLMLACAILTQSYAIFVLGPLLFAELVRWLVFRRRNLSFGIVPLLSLTALVIAVEQSRRGLGVNGEGYAAQHRFIASFYSTLLEPMGMEIALLLALFAGLWFVHSTEPVVGLEPGQGEVFVPLATTLFLLPLIVAPLSVAAKLPFLFRYAIAAGIGFSLVAAWLLFLLRSWRAQALPLALAVIGGSFAFQEFLVIARFAHRPTIVPDRAAFYDPEAKSLPIFAQDPYLYLEMLFNWPADMRENLHYVLDNEMTQRMIGPVTTERNVAQLLPIRALQIETYAELRSSPQRFLLYYDTAMNRDEIKGWLLKRLLDDGTPIELLRRHGDILVYLVTIPGPH